MIHNYFKVALRNLVRNKVFSIIKIAGLSIGLTVCVLIFLYSKDELSYDQFHENKAQLYRVTQTFQFEKKESQVIGTTNAILGETFKKEIPEVLQAVHINGALVTVKKENNDVFNETPLFVEDNFFSIFSFQLSEGNSRTALNDPYSVVLSKDLARKYYGTTDVIGKIMQVKVNEEFENFTITAIAENSPQNSTLKTGMYLPFKNYEKYIDTKDWFGGSLNTFLLLAPHADVKTAEAKMQAVYDNNTKEIFAKIRQEKDMNITVKLGLQPLTSIHLSTEAGPDNGMTDGSKPVYSYILNAIAVFILIIACINFINLAIAQSLKRSREVGVRKVVGGTRKQLVKQFMAESFLVSLLAFIIAILLTVTILPFFNEIANKKLSLSYLADGYFYVGLFLLLLLTSFIAGFYPSLVLSSFQPVKVLQSKQRLMGKNYFTKGLIVLQFTLAILLIIGTIAVNTQLNFLSNTNLGYDSKNLVRITLPVRKSSDPIPDLFRNELASQNDIISVSGKNSGRSISEVKADGKKITIEKSRIDEFFLPTFKIPVVAGRNFSPAYPSDLMASILVNETFVKEAGWQANAAIGKTIGFMSGNIKSATIVGVVKDYHFMSLKEKIMPQLFTMDTNFNYGQVVVKIKPGNIPQTLTTLQSTFKKLVPYFPYSYDFMDDLNARNYETEAKWKEIISISSILFIFISCIGLLGLVMLSIEQRKKEIGIRKVLGAAVARIIVLISKEFIILISIAFVIAAPLGYYAINKWLQDFSYRTNIGWWMFAGAGAIVIAVALLTMSFQAIKAAMANPVKSLRTE